MAFGEIDSTNNSSYGTGNTSGTVPGNGHPKGMLQKMVATRGPQAGKREFFATLQKRGKLRKGIVKKLGSGKKSFL